MYTAAVSSYGNIPMGVWRTDGQTSCDSASCAYASRGKN